MTPGLFPNSLKIPQRTGFFAPQEIVMKKLIALALIAGMSAPAHAATRSLSWLASACIATGGTVTDYGSRKVGAIYIPWVTCTH